MALARDVRIRDAGIPAKQGGLALLLLVPLVASAELRISDIDRELERNIRAYVELADEPCDAEPWRIRRRFRNVAEETREALQPFGFYQPDISTTLELGDDCWTARLDVTPGEPVLIRDVDIRIDGEATGDAEFARLQPAGLQTGERLRHAAYDRYKQSLQILAADRGYVEARFTESRLDVWPDELAADVLLRFDSGPRYRIGTISQDQDFLEQRLVSGFLDLEEGAFFDSRDLARAYQDLSNSAYFGRVEVVPDFDGAADGAIPVRVNVEPGTRIEYTVGVGASTDTGPRFRAGFRNNRLNRKGHRFISDLSAATAIQGLSLEYRKPLTDPRTDWMSYTAGALRQDNDTFTDDTGRVGVRRSKRLSSRWIRTLSLDLTYENYRVGEDEDTSVLVLPAIAFDHKVADRDVYPTRGRRFRVEFIGASSALGSDTSFLQVRSSARLIRTLGPTTRMIARTSVGTTIKSDFLELPPSARFFAGGDESVRGFDFDSLGPEDSEGNVIGGTSLLVASVEFERRLRGNYYGAVFVDGGNAFDGFDIDPAVGTGLGVKWRSPIGPVRVYVGFPLTGEESGPRLHLRLGADL